MTAISNRAARALRIRSGRRGASLVEVQTALLVMALIGLPALTMIQGLYREVAWVSAETTIRQELERALAQMRRTVRGAAAIPQTAPDSLEVAGLKGGKRRFYVENGTLWIQFHGKERVPLAEGVQELRLTYYRTQKGKKQNENSPGQVSDVEVRLTLQRGGVRRSRTILISMRGRPR